jgi:hypothetical protein
MERPTYEELEKKVKQLEFRNIVCQNSIGRFLQAQRKATLELIIENKLAIKSENYYGHAVEFLDLENPNVEYIKNSFTRVIGVID